MTHPRSVPPRTRDLIIRAALKEMDHPTRRRFLKQGLSLGALSLLMGCDLTDESGVEPLLRRISAFNDGVQGWLFDPSRLAPTFTAADITRPFPFNAFYTQDKVPSIDPQTYRLEVRGLVEDTRPWCLADLAALPQKSAITRHICIEGWSAIGTWGGVGLGDFLNRVGADRRARYVQVDCADRYSTSLDMASACHPQTLIALTMAGETLAPRHGFPVKIRVPTKLGFKNPKHVVAITVTNDFVPGFWERQGYNWFSGL